MSISQLRLLLLCLLCWLCHATVLQAGVTTAAIRETVEFIEKKFVAEAAETGIETLTKRLTAMATKYGDNVLVACRKVGPQALRYADDAGAELAPAVFRYMARYGDDALKFIKNQQLVKLLSGLSDDAAEVVLKFGPDITEKMLIAFGDDAAKALLKLSKKEALELAGRFASGELAQLPANGAPKLLNVLAKYGDQAMEFTQKHWKVLLGAAAFTAFVSDPEPYLNGTKELANVVAENTVGKVSEAIAGNTNWTLWLSVVGLLIALLVAFRMLLQHRLKLRTIK